MNIIHLTFAGAALAAAVSAPLLSQQQARLSSECRSEVMELCGRDRTKIRSCLTEKSGDLSEGCQAEIKKRMEERAKQRESRTQKESD